MTAMVTADVARANRLLALWRLAVRRENVAARSCPWPKKEG